MTIEAEWMTPLVGKPGFTYLMSLMLCGSLGKTLKTTVQLCSHRGPSYPESGSPCATSPKKWRVVSGQASGVKLFANLPWWEGPKQWTSVSNVYCILTKWVLTRRCEVFATLRDTPFLVDVNDDPVVFLFPRIIESVFCLSRVVYENSKMVKTLW